MSLRLLSILRGEQTRSALLIARRYVHRNHPGHKPKPLVTPTLYDLPDKYNDEVNYPPVKPKYPPGVFSKDYDPKLAWNYYSEGEKYHSLRTIQERLSVLAYLNITQTLDDLKNTRIRHFPIYQLKSYPEARNSLPFIQFITQTHLEMTDRLPSVYEEKGPKSNKLFEADTYNKLKYCVIQSILTNLTHQDEVAEVHEAPVDPNKYVSEDQEFENRMKSRHNNSNKVIRDIMNMVSSVLSTQDTHRHLLGAQYGQDVDIKAYWKRCGFKDQKPRGALPDPDVIRFQFEDVASYQIKTDMPLKPLYNLDDNICTKHQIQPYAYHPSNFRVFADHVLPMQVPGHWYGDSREFNYLTVFNTTKMIGNMGRKFNDSEANMEALKNMAISCGHAELTSQAYYLGFSQWKNVTYPLMGQFIFTNGQDFSLANYQLNNLQIWNKANSTNNLCFLTKPRCLYKLSEDRKTVTDFNDELFKDILNMLSNQPVKNDTEIVKEYKNTDYKIGGTRLRPYLSIQNFEEQLEMRHKLFAISLYELVKYDKPLNYLNLRDPTKPINSRPKFPVLYDKFTYEFRDIVLDYYPQDYFGFRLIKKMLAKNGKITEKFWDTKTPVYEWINVPPPKTNNIPRVIDLQTY